MPDPSVADTVRSLPWFAEQTLNIGAGDAAVLGVHDGDLVEIASRYGRAELPARLSNDVEPGQLFAGSFSRRRGQQPDLARDGRGDRLPGGQADRGPHPARRPALNDFDDPHHPVVFVVEDVAVED